MALAFKIGDQAVYAGHGVGVITAIEKREISGNTETFYSVRIQESEANILVPQSRTGKKGGLRPLASKESIFGVIDILKGKELTVQKINNWNKKLQEYSRRLKTGQLSDAAYVLKDLTILKNKKNLSFGEKQLMEQAWNLLFRETSLVLGKDKSKNLLEQASGMVFEKNIEC